MGKEIVLTAHTVCQFLGIGYSRLDQWFKKGVLTIKDQKYSRPGSGTSRLFTEEDVVAAKLALYILESIKSFELAKRIVKDFRKKSAEKETITKNGYLFYQIKSDMVFWLNKNVKGKDIDIARYLTGGGFEEAILMIPVFKIYNEVKEFFSKLQSETGGK